MGRYAVLGDPVEHSLSPQIFQCFAKQSGEELTYQALVVKPEALSAKLTELSQLGYQGVNLTAPLKEKAFSLIADCSESARLARAINVLSFRQDGCFYGDNSDGLGLIRDLVQNKNYTIEGQSVLMLGAGGAARGIVAKLLDQSPSQLTIYNRHEEKAQALIRDIQHPNRAILGSFSGQSLAKQRFDLILNCTSAGQQGKLPALPANILNDQACCYDLSYGASAVPFLAWAKEQGAAYYYDGLGMLVEQAAQAFLWWCGKSINTAPVLQSLNNTSHP